MNLETILTPANVTMLFTVFLTIWQVGKSILRVIAGKTETKYDDNALSIMESAESRLKAIDESEWVKTYAPAFWAQVEAISTTQVPALKGAGKLCYFLGMAHKAYVEATGKALSGSGAKALELVAGGLSAQAKIGAAANPTQAAPAQK